MPQGQRVLPAPAGTAPGQEGRSAEHPPASPHPRSGFQQEKIPGPAAALSSRAAQQSRAQDSWRAAPRLGVLGGPRAVPHTARLAWEGRFSLSPCAEGTEPALGDSRDRGLGRAEFRRANSPGILCLRSTQSPRAPQRTHPGVQTGKLRHTVCPALCSRGMSTGPRAQAGTARAGGPPLPSPAPRPGPVPGPVPGRWGMLLLT